MNAGNYSSLCIVLLSAIAMTALSEEDLLERVLSEKPSDTASPVVNSDATAEVNAHSSTTTGDDARAIQELRKEVEALREELLQRNKTGCRAWPLHH